MSDDHHAETPVPDKGRHVPPDSILGRLGQRRDEVRAAQVKVIAGPRWTEPEIFVRFRLLSKDDFDRVERLIKKAKRRGEGALSAAELNANIDILVNACVGVFARLDGHDGTFSLRPGDPDGDETRFDAELGANLGLDTEATARDVARALYVGDGDLLSTATQLAEWSNFTAPDTEDDLEGE
jgi:hypothetical protein